MSRLDEIRRAIDGCACWQCQMTRELLAVVDAVLQFADATTAAEAAAWFRGEEMQNADAYVAGDETLSAALAELA